MTNGILLMAMVTMAAVVAITLAEIVQAYSACRYEMRHPGSGTFVRTQRPPSLLRPANRTNVPLFPQGRLNIQEEGCR